MPIPPKTSSDRSFGVVFAAVFVLIGVLPALDGHDPRPGWLVAAVVFLLAARLKPEMLAPLNKIWTRFGLLLNNVTAPIVMSVLFLTIFTPIGLLMRLFGRRPLQLLYEREVESYWILRQTPSPESMQRPF